MTMSVSIICDLLEVLARETLRIVRKLKYRVIQVFTEFGNPLIAFPASDSSTFAFILLATESSLL